MIAQEDPSIKLFTTEDFDKLFDRHFNNTTIEATIGIAAADPIKLYYFMQRYAYFNSFAGSLVARLASSIGISYKLFQNKETSIIEQADQGLEIAAKVLAATIDEHADAGAQNVPHRTLAQITLKAVGEYSKLSNIELNKIGETPKWMDTIIDDLIAGYQGQIDHPQFLATALGFHIGSELLADQEYSLLDKVVRYTHRGKGFDAWLRGKQVEIEGKKISPWYWVVVHGKHNASGVEAEHFQLALDALNLFAQDRPESHDLIFSWAANGFLQFADLQQRLFNCIKVENMMTLPSHPVI
jgi:hypothetical protein